MSSTAPRQARRSGQNKKRKQGPNRMRVTRTGDQELPLDHGTLLVDLGQTTVFIGPNNAGKTAILDALRIALTRRWGQRGTGFTEYDVHLGKRCTDDPKTSDGVSIELRRRGIRTGGMAQSPSPKISTRLCNWTWTPACVPSPCGRDVHGARRAAPSSLVGSSSTRRASLLPDGVPAALTSSGSGAICRCSTSERCAT